MFHGYLTSILLIISIVLFLFCQLYAQEEKGEIIIISERLGKEIDPEERDKFKLFQGINGFQSAVYIKLPDGRYFLKITYLDDKSGETKISRTLQSEASIKNRGNYIDRFEEIQARKEEEERGGEIIIVSERVGEIIDQEERDKYKLFQEVKGFQSAVFLKLPDNSYILKIVYKEEQTRDVKVDRIQESKDSINNIRNCIDHFGEKQAHQDTVYQAPGIAFFLELGGKLWYSLDVDYRRNKSEAMSLGIQWIGNGFFPYLMYYRFRGESYRSEIGGGFSGVVTDDGLMAVAIHGVLGYRYQKKNGLIYRIGFTPFIGIPLTSEGRFMIVPWAGISVGYSL